MKGGWRVAQPGEFEFAVRLLECSVRTEEHRLRLIERLESTSWRTYSTDTLEAVARLLAPTTEENEG